MRSLLALFIVSITITICSAQETPKGEVIEYFDKEWKTVTDVSRAAYFRTVEMEKKKYIVRDYFMSGKIQMEAECSGYEPKLVFDGKQVIYYENGNVKEEGSFRKNFRDGIYRSFYEDGQAEKHITYSQDNNVKTRYNHYYSREGKELLPNGNGVIPEILPGPGPAYMEIENYVAYGSFAVANGDTVYTLTEKPIEYKGGLPQLGRDITATLEYPEYARKMRIEGLVFVYFLIGKDGKILEASVIKGIDPSCDKEALRVIRNCDNWKPAVHRGKIVKARFVQPIRFKLER